MDPDKDILDFKPDPLVAIKRELKEETGIEETVSVISPI
jgi:8-oxo-dGTP pyrophosphatase MutT (NUDIX family)